jgi:hypothetical protein
MEERKFLTLAWNRTPNPRSFSPRPSRYAVNCHLKADANNCRSYFTAWRSRVWSSGRRLDIQAVSWLPSVPPGIYRDSNSDPFLPHPFLFITQFHPILSWTNSSVSIVTSYGLDGGHWTEDWVNRGCSGYLPMPGIELYPTVFVFVRDRVPYTDGIER